MKTIISTIILVSIAVLIGSFVGEDPGKVTIAIAGKEIETSLVFLVFIFFVGFIALLFTMKIVLYFYHLPECMGAYRNKQKKINARLDLTNGLIDLSEGKWAISEKKLVKLAEYSDAKLINYLAAARAAQHQNAHDRRDAYLKKAIDKNPEANIAVGITQAELQISHNQIEQALATLNWLQKLSPKHLYVKKLLAKIYIHLNDWKPFTDLIPELRKHQLFNKTTLDKLEIEAYLKRIDGLETEPKEVVKLWESVPKALKTNKEILYQYCQKLLSLNDAKSLEKCIRTQWDERIIRLYGLVDLQDSSKMLVFAESLLKEHNQSPMLFLTLGRICMQRELWGKAKTYFQQSLEFQATSEIYQELAELHNQLNEFDDANAMYKDGLNLVIHS
jgi:HemY protein